MKLWLPLISLALLLPGDLGAAQHPSAKPAKAAWQWTNDERLAARFDPASIIERSSPEATQPYGASASATPSGRMQSQGVGTPRTTNIIIGRRNPELFMPFELFDRLVRDGVSAADADAQARFRERLSRVIAPVMNPQDFWLTIETASQPFANADREVRHLSASLSDAASDRRPKILREINDAQQPMCRARAEALLLAEKSIGREKLYRVLYDGVAPELSTFGGAEATAEQMRHIAGGCQ